MEEFFTSSDWKVLILVLMEYALWPGTAGVYLGKVDKGLNPCSNGICSLTWRGVQGICKTKFCLNPCSNGICSLTTAWEISCYTQGCVLILVLMEYALWRWSQCNQGQQGSSVLILVLMEYALWLAKAVFQAFNSMWVLILVLMEYALWLMVTVVICL